MFEGIHAFFAARRMKLRHKGKTKKEFKRFDGGAIVYEHFACPKCITWLRIGITENRHAVLFCWKCEIIYDPESPPPPKSKEPIPKEEEKIEAKGNVIPFPNRRSA